ncbi:MAG: citrulline utilization hydrolase CtlX [Woeseiaceae bacterium]
MKEAQVCDSVLAIRPCRFQANVETAASNAFQASAPWEDAKASNAIAEAQFDGLIECLLRLHVNCVVVDDTPDPHTPDSIFPNNWMSTHADGTVALYPMEAVNRRTERRSDVLTTLVDAHGFRIDRQVDLSSFEMNAHFLEGTGSLVLDRNHRLAYACLSTRTHIEPLDEFDREMGYRSVRFVAKDASGQVIYHTNVMMCVGQDFCVLCEDAMDAEDRVRVRDSLLETGHDIIPIGFDALNGFAGNMLALEDSRGQSVIALSQQAFEALDAQQKRRLERYGSLAIADINHIETQSGGSVRCMLAEIHLPKGSKVA